MPSLIYWSNNGQNTEKTYASSPVESEVYGFKIFEKEFCPMCQYTEYIEIEDGFEIYGIDNCEDEVKQIIDNLCK